MTIMNRGLNSLDLDSPSSSGPVTVIEPRSGWRFIDLRELWEYRDLFYFLVWRDIKVRYAQSILGIGWAIIQPVFSMIVFTIVFGKLAKISSDGVPYAIFSFAALVPWTYFSNSLTDTTGSLIASPDLLTKVYFPRLIIPTTPVLSKLVDFGISLLLLFVLMIWFNTSPTIWASTLPLLIILMMLTAAGLGMWLTALAIQYRDIKYGMSFGVRLLMYAAPVVYPASLIPQKYRLLYSLNPMAGVIEGFRAALLGTRPMPWDMIVTGSIAALVIAISGALYFRRMQHIFADVV
jgi:lipopolysaccharide transport system permease protein